MNAKTIFPSKYIKAEDLKGKAVTVQIANVEIEEIGKTKDKRPVVYFRGKEKGMVLNKTNVNKICEVLGTDETDEWFGGLIILYPTEVEFQGAVTMAIRVRAPSANMTKLTEKPPPKMPLEEREPGSDDGDEDVPFDGHR